MKKSKKTINSKLIIFIISLLMIVVLAQLFFSMFLSRTYFIHQKQNELENFFDNIKSEYTDNPIMFNEILKEKVDIHNIKITIFSDNGGIYTNREGVYNIFSFPFIPYGKNQLDDTSSILTIDSFKYNPKAIILKNNNNQNNTIVLTGLIDYNGENRYVLLWTPIESIDASVTMFTKINLFISSTVLLIGIIATFLFSKKLSNPIRKIDEIAKNVAHLNFSNRANENTTTLEIANLATNVNIMSDKLNKMIIDLQNANKSLEKDINYQKQIDKMRQEFIANVSHEMKTPLCLLLMYSENLKNNFENIDKDYYCDTIADEANRLNDMVMKLLDISSIENGLSKMSMNTINLSSLTESIINKTKLMFENYILKIDIQKNIYILGNENYLEQAIKNYISNAISNTQTGKTISINLYKKDHFAIYSIKNEGNNIDENDLPHIWDSFYKSDKARTRQEETHVGLGLYIVKTIIEAHNGTCNAYNIENSVEFDFKIPITENT